MTQPNSTSFEPTPKGKRSIRRNVWGNLNGYVSGKFWYCFGNAFSGFNQEEAEAWCSGKEIGEEI